MRLKYLTLLALPFLLGSCNQKSVIKDLSVDFCISICKQFAENGLTDEQKEGIENVTLRFYGLDQKVGPEDNYTFVVFSIGDTSNDGGVETISGCNFEYANANTHGYVYDGEDFTALKDVFMSAEFGKEDVQECLDVYETGFYNLDFTYDL